MNAVTFLGDALRRSAKTIEFLAIGQAKERRRIVDDLQAICSRCDDAYATLLKRLKPVKKAYGDRKALADALRDFATDESARSAFKPEYLCAEVDQLLQRLASYADWTRYSIDARRIQEFKEALELMGNYDGQLWDYYDAHTRAMDELASELASMKAGRKASDRMSYAEHIVSEFENDLRQALKEIRKAKREAREKM